MRSMCQRCQRPNSVCYCASLPCLTARTEVLILQHPNETKHPLNTARIIALSIPEARVVIGEEFAPELWQGLNRRPVLLFPGPEAICMENYAYPPEDTLLIVLDGTWRKAQKMLHQNAALSALPRVTLPANMRSNYRLRKAKHSDALSTVEATAYALNALEKTNYFNALLVPFERMITKQIAAIPPEVYQKNYPQRI